VIYVIITIVAIAANAGIAAATFAHAKFVDANFGEINIAASWVPAFATLQAAGAIGLLLGLVGIPLIGLAAAIGLVLFFLGAVITHLRSRAYRSLASPLFFLALAVATLVVTLIR
jgi:hypothetical protein